MSVEFGRQVARSRAEAGLTLTEVARLVGEDEATVALIESGNLEPSGDLQILLETHLPGIRIDADAAIAAQINIIGERSGAADGRHAGMLKVWHSVLTKLSRGEQLDEKEQAALDHFIQFSGEYRGPVVTAQEFDAMQGALARMGRDQAPAPGQVSDDPSPVANEAEREADYAEFIARSFVDVNALINDLGLAAEVSTEALERVEELKQWLLRLDRPEAELPDEEVRWLQGLLGQIKKISQPAYDMVGTILRHPFAIRVLGDAIRNTIFGDAG